MKQGIPTLCSPTACFHMDLHLVLFDRANTNALSILYEPVWRSYHYTVTVLPLTNRNELTALQKAVGGEACFRYCTNKVLLYVLEKTSIWCLVYFYFFLVSQCKNVLNFNTNLWTFLSSFYGGGILALKLFLTKRSTFLYILSNTLIFYFHRHMFSQLGTDSYFNYKIRVGSFSTSVTIWSQYHSLNSFFLLLLVAPLPNQFFIHLLYLRSIYYVQALSKI